MKDALWALALLGLLPINYWATRTCGERIGKVFLIISSLPAAALLAFTGFRLGYALLNADEVNRGFRQGDLTYFGADMAFVVSLALAGLWKFLAYAGFRWGRDQTPT